jgi:hypothetical protein
VLGDVDASVVSAAFGYFNPTVVAMMWDSAREHVEPRTAGREFLEAAHEFGRDRLTGAEQLDGFVDAATRVVEQARRNLAGLSLFAAASAEPVPEDAPAAAMHLLSVLREFRGSAHLLAVVAQMDDKAAHFLRRPEAWEMFGWSKDDVPAVGDGERAALAAADALTDHLVAPAYSVLDDEGAASLLGGLAEIAGRLSVPTIPGLG